jgi:RecA-family ATPase
MKRLLLSAFKWIVAHFKSKVVLIPSVKESGKNISRGKTVKTSFSRKTESGDDYRVVTGRELLENDIAEIPMLWGLLFPKCGIAVLSGSSDVGKSSFLRQLSLAIATKLKEFLGLPLTPTLNSVIYVCSEDDEFSLSARIKKEFIKGSSNEDYSNLRIIIDSPDLVDNIKTEIAKKPADCVIIDPWLDFLEGDSNASFNTRSLLKDLRTIAIDNHCLIIINHHNRKSASEEDTSKNSLLGSQSLEAKARIVLMLTKEQDNRNVRYLTISKGNYIPDELKKNKIILRVNENFIFEYEGNEEVNSKMNKLDERKIENDEAVSALLKQGLNASQIVSQLPKIVKNPLKRSAVYKHIEKAKNPSMSTPPG